MPIIQQIFVFRSSAVITSIVNFVIMFSSRHANNVVRVLRLIGNSTRSCTTRAAGAGCTSQLYRHLERTPPCHPRLAQRAGNFSVWCARLNQGNLHIFVKLVIVKVRDVSILHYMYSTKNEKKRRFKFSFSFGTTAEYPARQEPHLHTVIPSMD